MEANLMNWQENSAQLKANWDRDGYVVVRQFLSEEEVIVLRGEIDRYISDVLPGVPELEVMYEEPGKPETLKRLGHMSRFDDYFENLINTGKFVELAEVLLGDKVDPQYCQLFNKPARVGLETPPHQDGFYIPLIPQSALTMWLALNEADEKNGCLRYVKGAHLKGVRPHNPTEIVGFSQGIVDFGNSDLTDEVPVPASPGDVLIHHWLMIHRAEPNESDRERWGLGTVFYAEGVQQDEVRMAAYREELEKAKDKWVPNMGALSRGKERQ